MLPLCQAGHYGTSLWAWFSIKWPRTGFFQADFESSNGWLNADLCGTSAHRSWCLELWCIWSVCDFHKTLDTHSCKISPTVWNSVFERRFQPTNEDSAQCFLDVTSPSHPVLEFIYMICVLDLLIICSSLQYISFCPDVYLLATFSAVLATIVSWLVFFYIFLHLQFCNVWGAPAMTQHPSNIWHCNVQGPIPSALAEYTYVWTCLSRHWMLDAWICFFPPSPHSLRSLDDMNDMMTGITLQGGQWSHCQGSQRSQVALHQEGRYQRHRGRCSTKAKGIQWCGWFRSTQEAASC